VRVADIDARVVRIRDALLALDGVDIDDVLWWHHIVRVARQTAWERGDHWGSLMILRDIFTGEW